MKKTSTIFKMYASFAFSFFLWHNASAQKICAGSFRSYSVCGSGNLNSWGSNLYGMLGDSTTTNRIVPGAVKKLRNVKSIVSSPLYSMALLNDGTVWAWGNNSFSQLGDSTDTERLLPVKVKNLTDVVQIAYKVDINNSNPASYALKSDGTVWSWGS